MDRQQIREGQDGKHLLFNKTAIKIVFILRTCFAMELNFKKTTFISFIIYMFKTIEYEAESIYLSYKNMCFK